MDQITVWKTVDGYSTNAAIILGKEWGLTPHQASLVLTGRILEDLKNTGLFDEISFTLKGQQEPIWRLDLALDTEAT